ncbi:MAG: rhodanese-like domain-containing protein [Hydrogenothermaceae bacterium]|nr:rhodanese-like domain-containing protein [Hydrogenothermaceae bacterium]
MKKAITVLLLIFVNISFAFENLSAKDFYNLTNKEKGILILDVRTPQEYREDGHISGSILIPIQILPQYIKELDKFRDKKILVYCRSGNRSIVASKFLEQNSFKYVYNLKGGIIEWKKSNLPVEYK